MNKTKFPVARVRRILAEASRTRVLVVGDAMLDHFIWGSVARISPEAPVPVVDFERESFMPGGAANVARNLTALQVPTELLGAVGRDPAASQLKRLAGGLSHRLPRPVRQWRAEHQREDPHRGPQAAGRAH